MRVLPARDFHVIEGVNCGDGLGIAADLHLGDGYALRTNAQTQSLPAATLNAAHPKTYPTPLHIDCQLHLLDDDARPLQVCVLCEINENGAVKPKFCLPLDNISSKTTYRLVHVTQHDLAATWAQGRLASFTRGMHISLASGATCPVEDLKIGDRILTRDHGPQTVRRLETHTQRASGKCAPVRIKAGVFGNTKDLVLNPASRIFIYQRRDTIGLGQPGVLVTAETLINHDSVFQETGGFVDYFQVYLDQPELIYAQGIAVQATARTKTSKIARANASSLPGHPVTAQSVTGQDIAKFLRSAQLGQDP